MLYQPLQNVSVDERMVKSKARCHLVQYMKNKPVKWGFKYLVIADTTGYTANFDLYTGRETDRSVCWRREVLIGVRVTTSEKVARK